MCIVRPDENKFVFLQLKFLFRTQRWPLLFWQLLYVKGSQCDLCRTAWHWPTFPSCRMARELMQHEACRVFIYCIYHISDIWYIYIYTLILNTWYMSVSIARAVSERDKTSCENTRRRMDRGCQNMSAAMWDWGWGDLESNGRGWQKSLQEAAWQKFVGENLPSVWDDGLDLCPLVREMCRVLSGNLPWLIQR